MLAGLRLRRLCRAASELGCLSLLPVLVGKALSDADHREWARLAKISARLVGLRLIDYTSLYLKTLSVDARQLHGYQAVSKKKYTT